MGTLAGNGLIYSFSPMYGGYVFKVLMYEINGDNNIVPRYFDLV